MNSDSEIGIKAGPNGTEKPSFPESERRQLPAWNGTEGAFHQNRCLHHLVEAQARKTPEAPAVVSTHQRLTYRELIERADRLANRLTTVGAKPESLVLLCMERSLEAAVAILGVLKAGAAYVPVDPSCPPERLRTILSEARPVAVLTQAHLATRFVADGPPVIALDESAFRPDNNKRAGDATPENLAYVIFTSGSTGKPKGVMIPHRALVNHATAMARFYELGPRDRVLQFASLSFDVAAEEIYPTWLSGATVVLWPETSGLLPIANFLKFVERHRITVLNLPTPYWDEWVMDLDRLDVPRSVRLVIVGSEKVTAEKYSIWRSRIGSRVRWCNAYGPTEATITSTAFEPAPNSEFEGAHYVPIGRPIANTRAYVLDPSLNLVPAGTAGELHIAGAGLARGYLNMPDLTAEKFIHDPFSTRANARMYRTGDLARCLPDGNLEFLGRMDHQVKFRGYRIELEEIEAAMRQHQEVGSAVAVLREDAPGGKRLVGYFIAKGGTGPSAEALAEFLRSRLPSYMVPAAFTRMDRLPLTPGGKVDRGKLPPPSYPEIQQRFVAPTDPLEAKLVQLWEKVLGAKPVGIKDNFFDLGGHSLLVLRLIAQIEKAFDVNLTLAVLAQAPTIEQLALLIRQKTESQGAESLLFACQADGSKRALFSYGGTVQLARYLGPDQPFYLLQSHGLDGRRAPETIEEMAQQCIDEIRAIQPQGPYFFAGYSFGGLVMFEVAQQLAWRGEQIALLVLIDPCPPKNREGKRDCQAPLSGVREKFAYHWCVLAGLEPKEKRRYLAQKIRERGRWMKFRTLRIACEMCFRLGRFLPPSLRLEYFMQITEEAIQRYNPTPFSGPLIVLRGPASGTEEEWRKLAADRIDFEEVAVDHLDIMKEPYVQALAGKLKKFLERAQVTLLENSSREGCLRLD